MKLSPRVGVGQGADMDWARILAYVTGTVDQQLLARNEYLAAENLSADLWKGDAT
jgi:hypothetical protein